MLIALVLLSISVLVFIAFHTLGRTYVSGGYSFAGRRTLRRMIKWKKYKTEWWTAFPLRQLLSLTARFVHMDEDAEVRLGKTLLKAEISLAPREYIAQKALICALGACMAGLCLTLRFYFGVLISLLITVFLFMRRRDVVYARVSRKEKSISQEMPRFVRTLCRSLQSDRDLYNAIRAYRKVAGAALAHELDILLAEMQTGNTQTALIHLESRLGVPEAFRLCAALQDMQAGIDQTATLSYMADDMARQAKEDIRKELSLRPGKMRATYYPAIGICVAMILYVLVVYVTHNLNSIL